MSKSKGILTPPDLKPLNSCSMAVLNPVLKSCSSTALRASCGGENPRRSIAKRLPLGEDRTFRLLPSSILVDFRLTQRYRTTI